MQLSFWSLFKDDLFAKPLMYIGMYLNRQWNDKCSLNVSKFFITTYYTWKEKSFICGSDILECVVPSRCFCLSTFIVLINFCICQSPWSQGLRGIALNSYLGIRRWFDPQWRRNSRSVYWTSTNPASWGIWVATDL